MTKYSFRAPINCFNFLVKSDNLDELVDLPDAVAVWAELPELEAHLTLGLGAVRTHTRGVIVTACKYPDNNDNILMTFSL